MNRILPLILKLNVTVLYLTPDVALLVPDRRLIPCVGEYSVLANSSFGQNNERNNCFDRMQWKQRGVLKTVVSRQTPLREISRSTHPTRAAM